MRPRAPLQHLRAFDAAARHESFKKAALELSVTPAAISAQIRELEDRIGVFLFDRHSKGVSLTPVGASYRDRIAPALRSIEQATAELTAPPLAGSLRISLPRSLGTHWLLDRLPAFRSRHPEIALSIDVSSTLRDLRRGEADLAIRFGAGRDGGLIVETVRPDAVTVIAPAGTREQHAARWNPGDVLAASCLLVDEGVGDNEPWSSWNPWLREAGVSEPSSSKTLRFPDAEMAFQACLAGLGCCIARRTHAGLAIREGRVQRIMPWRTTELSWHVAIRPEDAANPRIEEFKSWLVDELRTSTEPTADSNI